MRHTQGVQTEGHLTLILQLKVDATFFPASMKFAGRVKKPAPQFLTRR